MSESTLEAPAAPALGSRKPLGARGAPILAAIGRYRWWLVGVGLLVLAYILVHWAHTRPSYDAYGWLVWGYQTLHLNLDLGGAPSWKPLTWLFTVPFSLGGRHAVILWMVFLTAVALSGAIFAGRIAYRLTAGERDSGPAAVLAAVVAGAAVLGIDQYWHYILTSQSDPMITTLCLAAIDAHLLRRPRWAFACLVLAALGRPEAFPFVGLYAVWAWRAVPSARILLIAGLALIPILWFGVPTITNNRPFVSAQLAEFSVHRIMGNKFTGLFHRFFGLNLLPIQLLSLFTFVVAAVRRNFTVLALAAAALLWVLVELAFVLHGWPGLPRYMFEAGAIQGVLAGIGVGWIALEISKVRLPRGGLVLPRWVGIVVALAIVVTLVPGVSARVRSVNQDVKRERWRSQQITRLGDTIAALGGYRHVRYCGRPTTYVGLVSALAYLTNLNVGSVGYQPKYDLQRRIPTVLFSQRRNGWSVVLGHGRKHKLATCANVLNTTVVFTARHPRGLVVSVRHHARV